MKNVLICILLLFVSCKQIKETQETSSDSTSILVEAKKFEVEKLEMERYNEANFKVRIDKSNSLVSNPPNTTSKSTNLKIINITNNSVSKTLTNQGHLVYKIPSEMNIRTTYQVLVRISKSTVNIYENLNGEVMNTTIPITETMEVKLIDPSPEDSKMFSIVADNNGEQLVENGDDITQWTWNVTPLKIGTGNLKIVVSIIRGDNKKESVYEDNVTIKMDMSKQIPHFFNTNWKWFLSTLVLPLFIWLYKRRKNKKEDNKEEEINS